MPYLQIITPQGLLDNASQGALVPRISNAILKAERADVDDGAAQSLVWAHLLELPKTAIFVGGKVIDKPPLRIGIHTPQGALTDASRAELISEIGEIVDDIVGPMEGRLNHWAMLYEVADGNWGSGQVMRLPAILAAMNIEQAA